MSYVKTPEDEAWEALESKLGKKQVEQALIALQNEMEIYRNEVLEEVATELEQKFTLPFGQTTIESFASYIRGMKRE